MNSLQEDVPGAVSIIKARFPELDTPVIEKSLRNCIIAHTFPTNGILGRKAWETAVQMRRDVGDLRIDAPYDEYVVTKFADAAKNAR